MTKVTVCLLSLCDRFLRATASRICYRPSVCPSVRRVYHRKTVEVRIMKFSPYGSPIHLVFAGKFHPKILRDPPSGSVKQRRVG